MTDQTVVAIDSLPESNSASNESGAAVQTTGLMSQPSVTITTSTATADPTDPIHQETTLAPTATVVSNHISEFHRILDALDGKDEILYAKQLLISVEAWVKAHFAKAQAEIKTVETTVKEDI